MSMILALIRRVWRKRPDQEELDRHTLDDIGLTRMGLLNLAEFGPRNPEDGCCDVDFHNHCGNPQ